MDDIAATQVMQRFGKAFFNRDPALLAQAITADAQWHFAFGPDSPDGRVRTGVDGFLQGARENDALFERLRFNDVVCRGFGADQIVMTYLIDGQHRGGDAFSLRGIELITVRDGKLARKDVFWKQSRPA
ncbi:MAG: nuclear transport factor 2 family protein [Burkholderiaceae bacterium]|jgi:ketosteroid isomerase-like protein|nr:nuclear transport factor 2 family protein [Burkholderiaceae bacterium]MBP6815272.1 nuclear transport factor 2 family protein [Burkholderiaceae bacterium]MBP7661437.1 nuclear transport factor 2 family protein [Burkholderiaceae bacterium]